MGTTPLPPELPQEFSDALATTPSGAALSDYNYAAEAYDAVVMIALAAEFAKTDGSALAGEIVNVSREGEACTTYAECLPLAQAGTDLNYEGVSGPNDLNGNGEPLTGTYGVLHFGADNRIDDAQTTNVSAQAPDSAIVDLVPVGVEREGDGVLKIGSLLPQTGDLAFLGPPEFAGVELAIEDINAAGGVLGAPVEYSAGDSGDDKTDTANQTVDRLINQEGVDAIIGAAASGVTLNVLDTVTAAGVVQFSAANTSVALTDKEDNGLFFRNAPPDSLQGPVLADLVLADGAESAYILARDDAYGNGLVRGPRGRPDGLRRRGARTGSSTTRPRRASTPRSTTSSRPTRRRSSSSASPSRRRSCARWSSRASAPATSSCTAPTATWATPSARRSTPAPEPDETLDETGKGPGLQPGALPACPSESGATRRQPPVALTSVPR